MIFLNRTFLPGEANLDFFQKLVCIGVKMKTMLICVQSCMSQKWFASFHLLTKRCMSHSGILVFPWQCNIFIRTGRNRKHGYWSHFTFHILTLANPYELTVLEKVFYKLHYLEVPCPDGQNVKGMGRTSWVLMQSFL